MFQGINKLTVKNGSSGKLLTC